MKPEFIRNFSIVAHIDHGKSTLADRMMELTETVVANRMREQLLDDMELERERGITIKAKAVAMRYKRDGVEYLLNLIDTPGHVDFSYEVSRSMAACEGALLLVDASQGVEAQTVANAYLAEEAKLEILPVINKIDMVSSRVDEVTHEIEETFAFDESEVLKCSAKSGLGVKDILNAVIDRVPAPKGTDGPARALIFDSVYDDYRGVIVYFRVIDGSFKKGDKIRFLNSGRTCEITEIGFFKPEMTQVKSLGVGEVGYMTGHLRNLDEVKVGDTMVLNKESGQVALQGYKAIKQMVFCSIFPATNNDFESLRSALERLQLNDSSFTFEPVTSVALGFGFRCGFLGVLHMEIVQQRLERESNITIIQTAPNVTYEVQLNDGTVVEVDNPMKMPDAAIIDEIREPIAKIQIMTPQEHIGSVMTTCQDRRGIYKKTEYLSINKVMLQYEMPLGEIIFGFYDRLKSITRGYGTLDYEWIGFRVADMVKLDVLINGEPADALSTIIYRDNADRFGRAIIRKLQKEIPKHMFQIPLQASIGGRIIARENIRALSKNVTAKCYGGDITRKRKLLEKQKEGKKKMKAIGSVTVPQEAFMAVLNIKEDE